jgi:raffinose/stachyose/melibiose transport system permease protein
MSLIQAERAAKDTRVEQFKDNRQRRTITKYLTVAVFTISGMLLFIVFVLSPIFQSGLYSLYDWNGFGGLIDYVGLDNYERLYNHNIFRQAIQHSIVIMLLSLCIQLPVALAIALLVGRGELPGRRIFRAMLFIPYVFSEIITAIIWLYVLHPNEGLANTVFDAVIPGFEPVGWLGNRDIVLYSIFAVLVWKFFGFYMILYMAALQGVSKDLEDAARIDGANEWNVLRLITLPLIGPTIRLTVFLSVLGSVQQFVIIWVMTTGGPVNASEVMSTYLFKYGIQRFRLGYGSAVAVVLFVITLAFSLFYQRFVISRDYD